jgi:hypothetical protein
MSVKPASKPSKEWLDEKKGAEKAVAALRADSKANRLKKLKDFAVQTGGYDLDPKVAYKAAHYWFAFEADAKEAKVSTLFTAACEKARAMADPEFMRVAYSCLCIGGVPKRWPGMGPTLMKIFPEDERLKEAMMQQCVQAMVTYDDALIGLQLVAKGEKAGMPQIRVIARRANIYFHMYMEKKLKSDLDASIRYFEEAVRVDTDAERRGVAKDWADRLKKKRDAGEYKGG